MKGGWSLVGPAWSPMTTRVMYSCHLCGLRKIQLDVPAREEEDVKAWLDATARLVHVDHQHRTPGCPNPKIDDLMIPMTGTDRVGGPIVN